MSILGNINPVLAGDLIILAACLVISLPLAIWLGVFRVSAVVGPARLPEDRPAIPVVIAFFMAFSAMIVVASAYVIYNQHGLAVPREGPTDDMIDKAFLFSVPSLASMAVLILFDVLLGGRELLRFLGFGLGRFHVGVAMGLLGALVIVPVTYAVSNIVEIIYQLVQFQHPAEHELLTSLAKTAVHPIARWVFIASATIIAPLSEEMLFRGHLQTVIRRVLVTISSPPKIRPLVGFPITPIGMPSSPANFPPDATQPRSLPPLATVAPPVLPRPAVWQTWVAIIVTSCCFAAMHDRWMWPPIFFLSLGLGYCYERTGNIWTNITVHCLFNTASTVLFISSLHS